MARRHVVRCRRDVVLLIVALVVLALSAVPVERHQVDQPEVASFDLVNGAPSLPFAPVWLVMQLGSVVVIPTAIVVALWWRRSGLALRLAVVGVAAWWVAKGVKRVIVRPRPDALLNDVVIRGHAAGGLGFVSGHAAVAVGLAVVAFPYLGRRARWIVATLAAFVCLTRVYVGAHLPLDVVGGAALGAALGAGVRLVLGRPGPCSTPRPEEPVACS